MQQAEIFLQGVFEDVTKAQEEITLVLKYAQKHGLNGVRIVNGPQISEKEYKKSLEIKSSFQKAEDMDKAGPEQERDMSDAERSGADQQE